MRILIVDDDRVSCKLMENFLTPHGAADVAMTGQEALKLFHSAHDQGRPYDLICMDVMMPGMDGITLLKRVRNIEQERGIYGLDGVRVIMTTALSDERLVKEAFNARCEGYIVKPIRARTLEDEMKALGLLSPNNDSL